MDDGTALGNIAVNALLVFVAQGNAAAPCGIAKAGKTRNYLVGIFIGLALGHKKAEHTDVFRAEDIAELEAMLEAVKLLFLIAVYIRLSAGGADGPNGNAACIKLFFDFFCLFGSDCGDVLTVHSAYLKIRDAVFLQCGYLPVDALVCLIRKGA